MRLERHSSVYFVISFRVSARAVRATIFARQTRFISRRRLLLHNLNSALLPNCNIKHSLYHVQQKTVSCKKFIQQSSLFYNCVCVLCIELSNSRNRQQQTALPPPLGSSIWFHHFALYLYNKVAQATAICLPNYYTHPIETNLLALYTHTHRIELAFTIRRKFYQGHIGWGEKEIDLSVS